MSSFDHWRAHVTARCYLADDRAGVHTHMTCKTVYLDGVFSSVMLEQQRNLILQQDLGSLFWRQALQAVLRPDGSQAIQSLGSWQTPLQDLQAAPKPSSHAGSQGSLTAGPSSCSAT